MEKTLNKGIVISTRPFYKGVPSLHPDVDFVFTDNAEAYMYAHQIFEGINFGFPYKKAPKLNVSDCNGTNLAGIRTDAGGVLRSNTFGLVVKKYQHGINGIFVAKTGQFQDTVEDFLLFKSLVHHMLVRLINSKNMTIIFPKSLALGKSALPMDFAIWLRDTLDDVFKIKSEIRENTREDYIGYGLYLVGVE